MATRRTKQRRSSSSTSTRSTPYDLDLPENKTVQQLKKDLNIRGVEFPTQAKKSQLIGIWKKYLATTVTVTNMADSEMSDRATPNFPSMPHVPVTSQEVSHDAPRVNNNNDMNDRQLSQDESALEKLSATVNLLAEKVSKLEEKISPRDETSALAPRQGITSDHCPCPPVTNVTSTITSSSTTPTVPYRSYLDQVEVTNRPSPPVHSGSFSLATAMSNMGNNSYNSEMMNQNSTMSMAMPAALTIPQINNASQTQFGFAAESLPFVETISPQMKKQILEGKDVNLAALLIPYYSGPMNNDDKLNSEGCQANRKLDPRLNRNLNLNEFMQAFAIYKNVMCEAYPSRRKELDLYERDIVDMGTSYGGKGFYEYHKQFSSKAAAYLKYYNTKVDWSLRNNRLFCNIFASHKPITCNLCHSTDHTAGFCPELLLEKNQRSHKDNSQNAFSQNQTIDMYGRLKRFFQGKEICNNFNGERGCVRPACNRAHVCFTCNKEHSQLSCSQDRARSNGSKNFQRPRNQPQKS